MLKLLLGHKMPIGRDCPGEGPDIGHSYRTPKSLATGFMSVPTTSSSTQRKVGLTLILACLFRRCLNKGCNSLYYLEKTVTSVTLPGQICHFCRDLARLPMASLPMDRKKSRWWHALLEGYQLTRPPGEQTCCSFAHLGPSGL